MKNIVKNIKLTYYGLKYGKTLDLMNMLVNEDDDEKILKQISQTNIKELNQDIDKYVKLTNPKYDYNSPGLHVKAQATVLAAAMRNNSAQVILALLDREVNIHHFNPYYQLLKRKIRRKVKETGEIYDDCKDEKLIEITQKCLTLGLDLNWVGEIKKDSKNTINQERILCTQDNYAQAALDSCMMYINKSNYEINPYRFKHVKFLFEHGLKINDDKGELINSAIRYNNKEMLNYVLHLESVTPEYINKGVNNCISEFAFEQSVMNQSNSLEKFQEMFSYINNYLEKLSLENNIQLPQNEIKNNPKRKI